MATLGQLYAIIKLHKKTAEKNCTNVGNKTKVSTVFFPLRLSHRYGNTIRISFLKKTWPIKLFSMGLFDQDLNDFGYTLVLLVELGEFFMLT